ncbi:MAG: rhomboid family intramembrane serine protease [Ferruginibacter sp.]|nr:rhomboid family intramembrane serine protease [Ferruginibacter sp.]
MLMPIGDDNSAIKERPYVTYALIVANIIVWIVCQGMSGESGFTYAFSTVPAEIITGNDIVTQAQHYVDPNTGIQWLMPGLGVTPIPVYFTLLTSMFMHGGWMHLAGNMLYLWIFGDNLENRLGKGRYLIFYLLTGIIASLSHVFSTYFQQQSSVIPSLGASGAISGVLGGYMLLFPKLKVKALFLYQIIIIPAYVALGVWIGFQIVSGLLSGSGGGVAYAAHVGGFIAGLVLIKFFDKKQVAVM